MDLSVVVHIGNSSTWEVEIEKLEIQGPAWPHREFQVTLTL